MIDVKTLDRYPDKVSNADIFNITLIMRSLIVHCFQSSILPHARFLVSPMRRPLPTAGIRFWLTNDHTADNAAIEYRTINVCFSRNHGFATRHIG